MDLDPTNTLVVTGTMDGMNINNYDYDNDNNNNNNNNNKGLNLTSYNKKLHILCYKQKSKKCLQQLIVKKDNHIYNNWLHGKANDRYGILNWQIVLENKPVYVSLLASICIDWGTDCRFRP